MVSKPEDYFYGSVQAYYDRPEKLVGLTDVGFILGIFDEERSEAMHRFHEHMKTEVTDNCLDDEFKQKKTDSEVKGALNLTPLPG